MTFTIPELIYDKHDNEILDYILTGKKVAIA